MDLSQTKLTKSEWVSVEIPVSDSEKRILQLILDGYHTPFLRRNTHQSLFGYMKLDPTPEMEVFLYTNYFQPLIESAISKEKYRTPVVKWLNEIKTQKSKPLKKADQIRLNRLDVVIATQKSTLFEFVLLNTCRQWIETESPVHLYTLIHFRNVSISHLNPYVTQYADLIVRIADPASAEIKRGVFENACRVIERNPLLIQFQDETLYEHQRDLFYIFRNSQSKPKLVLYTAPTGTGKTMSPLGLSQEYRVIFVCVARHVGLALAKSAISVGKKVAFAFGCETSSDIRLHYFAAADYSINKRSGGIGKVDNSNGSKVEIMICDVASYPVAMYYMKAFHSLDKMSLYWDEPTISLDQETHDLHGLIQNVWTKNQVPNVVLSCATLPKKGEIGPLIHSFKSKFAEGSEVHVIDSYDCKKSITIMNARGEIVLPHLIFSSYRDLMDSVEMCDQNRSLLRYFDVAEIVRLLVHVNADVVARFADISNISLLSIKLFYLDVLRDLDSDEWPKIHQYMRTTLMPRFVKETKEGDFRKLKSMNSLPSASVEKPFSRTTSVSAFQAPTAAKPSGILLTTQDAHTLTDGPSLFLAEDVDKIGQFYIQQSKIPPQMFQSIQEKIERNNAITRQIEELEKESEDKAPEENPNSKKALRETVSKETQRLLDRISDLRETIQTVHLNPAYVPNTKSHQDIWVPENPVKNAFCPHIDEQDVREIMGLGIDNQKKLLLILGIGVFSLDADKAYMEIMKRLAYNQRLFLIVASSDYIYGTNYQFCHGFIGKDLANMTQQKTIQAIGRVGRNNIQQEYTVRFRDDAVIQRLFKREERNREAENMCRLFCEE